MRFLFLALTLVFAAPAFAATQVNGVWVDPTNAVRAELLTAALKVWDKTLHARRDKLVVVDFAKPSTEKRLHIVDLKTGAVEALLTAHGRGSDTDHDGRAENFSSTEGSKASALGAYLTTKRYFGQHGLSLKLRGLDAQTANVEERLIVLHSADYMRADYIARHGRPGRSWGCFVVEPRLIEDVVSRLEGGVLIYAGR
ncbi:MAG: murein L,D-transpeptidase catalytic domain family protein [Caulobacterales bacterium]|jgi:hypothetical protein